jgi:hypothetical protein
VVFLENLPESCNSLLFPAAFRQERSRSQEVNVAAFHAIFTLRKTVVKNQDRPLPGKRSFRQSTTCSPASLPRGEAALLHAR